MCGNGAGLTHNLSCRLRARSWWFDLAKCHVVGAAIAVDILPGVRRVDHVLGDSADGTG